MKPSEKRAFLFSTKHVDFERNIVERFVNTIRNYGSNLNKRGVIDEFTQWGLMLVGSEMAIPKNPIT
jgi:hypothetical protein